MLIEDCDMICELASRTLFELRFLLAFIKLMVSEARYLDDLVTVLASSQELAIVGKVNVQVFFVPKPWVLELAEVASG